MIPLIEESLGANCDEFLAGISGAVIEYFSRGFLKDNSKVLLE